MPKIRSLRLSDMGPAGYAGLLITGLSVVWFIGQIAESIVAYGSGSLLQDAGITLVVGFVGLAIAYSEVRPEAKTVCSECGTAVASNSAEDSYQEFTEVHASGAPERVSLGPVSVVTARRKESRVYCSGECADLDTIHLAEDYHIDKMDSDADPEESGFRMVDPND